VICWAGFCHLPTADQMRMVLSSSRNELKGVRREGNTRYATWYALSAVANWLASLGIPNAYCLIVAPRSDPLAIGRKGDRLYTTFMPIESVQSPFQFGHPRYELSCPSSLRRFDCHRAKKQLSTRIRYDLFIEAICCRVSISKTHTS
jgi:hypothetical protein